MRSITKIKRNRRKSHLRSNISKSNTTYKSKSSSSYTVHEIPHFLSNEECDKLIQISILKGLETSEVVNFDSNELSESINKAHRNSETAWLKKNNDIVERIAKRISELTNTPLELQEDLQCVRYQKGGIFKEHYDAYSEEELVSIYKQGNRQRFSTFLIYLNDDYTGGETAFPKIKKTVIPEKGKAIYFKNIDSKNEIIPESLHKGSRIKSGEKWIANIWIDLETPSDVQDQDIFQDTFQEDINVSDSCQEMVICDTDSCQTVEICES